MSLENKARVRVAGIVIKDEKLLLLKGIGYKELWTVGGKLHDNETDEECLRREVKEEIGVEIIDFKFYKKYSTYSFYRPDIAVEERVYIISIQGDIKPSAEIESYVWFSKDDYYSKKYPMITHTNDELILDLIQDSIW